LLSLNSVVYFKNTKLDVDLGYVSNDRSEFEDSDVAGLQMKLNTFNYNAKYHLPKVVTLNQLLGCRNASNQCELRRRIPYSDADQ
jgi:iron complex outermembrane receptor protein